MNPKVARPAHRPRLDPRGRTLAQDAPHQLEGRRVALRAVDGRDDAPPRGAHGKDGRRTEFARTQLQLVRRKGFVRLDIGEEEEVFVLGAFERKFQEMANRAVRAVAADHEGRADLDAPAVSLERGAHAITTILGGDERRPIFDGAASRRSASASSFSVTSCGTMAMNGYGLCSGANRTCASSRPCAVTRHRGHAIRSFEERADDSRHVEDLEGAGKDGERLGVFGLPRARLDDARREAAPSAFVRQKEADGASADDEDIGICRGSRHRRRFTSLGPDPSRFARARPCSFAPATECRKGSSGSESSPASGRPGGYNS